MKVRWASHRSRRTVRVLAMRGDSNRSGQAMWDPVVRKVTLALAEWTRPFFRHATPKYHIYSPLNL